MCYNIGRHYLWASGLDTSKIFIFDVHTDPAKPTLHKTIDNFVAKSGGVVGPHTNYAMPGRMLLTGLSNDKDHGGRTALVEYTNAGDYVATHWMPTDENLGGIDNELLDPLIQPLNLSEAETDQLLAFLKSLNGDNVDVLVADAFAVPVGNSGSE